MADIADRAQYEYDVIFAANMSRLSATRGQSAPRCRECDEPIPAARSNAVQGVSLCVDCQQLAEQRSKHYGV